MFPNGDIHALVSQLNDEFAAAWQRLETRRSGEIVQPIEPGLGTVTVLGTGELIAVDLHTYRVNHYSGSALARAVLEAIQRAEHRARDGRTT